MSDYSKTTNFTAKDSLTTGDPEKLILGADYDTEFDAIAVAIATKYDVTDLASQAEAEAGASSSKLMTPERTQQWGEAWAGENGGLIGDIQALADPGGDRLLFWDDSASAAAFLTVSTGLTLTGTSLTTNDGAIVHDNLSGFVANEHIDHSAVSISAGNGLTGGGTIEASRTLAVGAGTGISVSADAVALDTANTRNTDHAAVSITAGNGLTGGGAISATRTLTLGTPGSTSLSSTNAVTSTSHTHALSTAGIVRTEPGTGGQITVSTSAASGSATNGDIWLQV